MPVPDSSEYTRKLRLLAESITEPQDFAKQLYHTRISGIGIFNFLPLRYDVFVNTTPSYTISANATTLTEASQSVIFTITTTNVSNGTVLYWQNIGTTSSSDFTQAVNSGTITIQNGSATITFTTVADLTTEGSETLQIQLRTSSLSGTIVATSASVSITDSSVSPTYSVSANTTTVNEGSSVIFTITTTNVADGTTLYWTISGTAVAADFSDDASSGSFTITSNSGSITRTIKSDTTTEGSESFTLSVRTGSASGTIVATSETITINDTSLTPIAFTWGEQAGSPTMNYIGLRSVSDFSTIITTRGSSTTGEQGPYISTDNGATFTRRVTGMTFAAGVFTTDVIVARTNGSIMYAVNRGSPTEAPVWKSTDGGLNWSSSVSPANAVWACVVCSADGQVVLVGNSLSANATYNQRVAYSTNGGTTWTVVSAFSGQYQNTGFDMSADGTRMFVINLGANSLPIRRSTNTGSTWTTVTGNFRFYKVRCSDDGLTVIAARAVSSGTTYPYLSTDGGTTWNDVTGVPARANWGDCAISGDGQTIAVSSGTLSSGTIWMSVDGGTTWTEQTSAGSRAWASMAINSNGTKIIAGGTGIKAWVGTR